MAWRSSVIFVFTAGSRPAIALPRLGLGGRCRDRGQSLVLRIRLRLGQLVHLAPYKKIQ